MTTLVIQNPKVVTIGDTLIAAQGVTQFNFLAGTVSGGPYTTLTGVLLVSSVTVSASGATAPFADITWTPEPSPFVNYYCVCEAVDAQGASTPDPVEAGFSVITAPSAPTSLAFA